MKKILFLLLFMYITNIVFCQGLEFLTPFTRNLNVTTKNVDIGFVAGATGNILRHNGTTWQASGTEFVLSGSSFSSDVLGTFSNTISFTNGGANMKWINGANSYWGVVNGVGDLFIMNDALTSGLRFRNGSDLSVVGRNLRLDLLAGNGDVPLGINNAGTIGIYTKLTQSGTTAAFTGISTASNGTPVSVTFSPAFASTPKITLTPSAQVFCWITAKSASGFTCNCRNDSGSSQAPTVDWIATQ